MKYSISSHSRVSFIKHSTSLILLAGVLALSPWKQGQAQTGSEEGSTGTAGTMEPQGGGSRRDTMNPPGTGTESGSRSRGNTSSPSTTGPESDTGQGKHKGMGNKGRNGSGTGGSGNDGSGAGMGGSGTGGSPRPPQ